MHSECRRLKAHKEKEKTEKDNISNKAHTVLTSENSHSVSAPGGYANEKAFSANTTSNSPFHWILDSGCSAHLTSRKELFSNLKKHQGTVTVASGIEIPVLGWGTIHLNLRTCNGGLNAVTLEDVLYLPH